VNRLSVKKRQLVTQEGVRYGVLWMPDTERMLPETMEKLYELVCGGALWLHRRTEGADWYFVTAPKGRLSQEPSVMWLISS